MYGLNNINKATIRSRYLNYSPWWEKKYNSLRWKKLKQKI